MDFLQIFGEPDLRTLPAGQWGIREPDEVRDSARRPSGQSRLRSERSPLLTRRSTRAPLLRCNPSLGCTRVRMTHSAQRERRAARADRDARCVPVFPQPLRACGSRLARARTDSHVASPPRHDAGCVRCRDGVRSIVIAPRLRQGLLRPLSRGVRAGGRWLWQGRTAATAARWVLPNGISTMCSTDDANDGFLLHSRFLPRLLLLRRRPARLLVSRARAARANPGGRIGAGGGDGLEGGCNNRARWDRAVLSGAGAATPEVQDGFYIPRNVRG